MALSGAKYEEASLGQYGSSFLTGDGGADGTCDLNGDSATRYVYAITFLASTRFQALENLGGEVGSISTVTAENDHDHATEGFGAAGNATDIVAGGSGTQFPQGITIYGRWDYVELHEGSCICMFAPK